MARKGHAYSLAMQGYTVAAVVVIVFRVALEFHHMLFLSSFGGDGDDGFEEDALSPAADALQNKQDDILLTPGYHHYIMLEPGAFEARVHPRFANSVRLHFDINFSRLRDKYGLINVTFTDSELVYIFKRVVEIWAQANIHPRIWLPSALEPVDIGEGEAEAYRVLVTAPKRRNHPHFSEFRQRLAESAWGVENTQWMYKEILRANNPHCCEVERRIVGAHKRSMWHEQMVASVYALHYFRWYNAISLNSFIMIRGGSCWQDQNKKLEDKPVLCRLGYMDANGTGVDALGARAWEQYYFTPDHFVRIMAHELGHFLSLGHPFSGRCTEYKSFEEGLLMAQQRKIAVPGRKCSRRTEALDSIRLSEEEIVKARTRVMLLDGVSLPSLSNVTRLGITVHQLPFSTPLEQEGFTSAVIFTHDMYEVPCSGRVVRARLSFSSATPPDVNLSFFSTLGDTVVSTEEASVDLRPYLHHRHAEIDLSLPVDVGSRLGVAPRRVAGDAPPAAIFPAFVAKRLKKPMENWRPVSLDLSQSPGKVFTNTDNSSPKRSAFRSSLAWLINFDIRCE